MSQEDIDRDVRVLHARKFTKEFDEQYAKDNIETSPCNIWGYIKNLQEKIRVLEERITELENKQK